MDNIEKLICENNQTQEMKRMEIHNPNKIAKRNTASLTILIAALKEISYTKFTNPTPGNIEKFIRETRNHSTNLQTEGPQHSNLQTEGPWTGNSQTVGPQTGNKITMNQTAENLQQSSSNQNGDHLQQIRMP